MRVFRLMCLLAALCTLVGCDDSRATPSTPPSQTDGGDMCCEHNLAHVMGMQAPEVSGTGAVDSLVLCACIVTMIASERSGRK
jgi:hypothetical protein